VRFLFRGLYRDSGQPVEGHVEALGTDAAYDVLSENGIVTESLREDPRSLNVSSSVDPISEFENALESALDSSSSQIPFDALSERYRGKKVWVIDREKIRQRVAQVVDTTLAASEANSESGSAARERVANAISGLFHDNRNIASQRSADSVAGMNVAGATATATPQNPDALAEQIGRLNGVVEQAERMIAAMSAALRNAASGGGPRRHALAPVRTGPSVNLEQSSALHEIFQSNLELRRQMNQQPQPVVGAG
jgi:hypothetical protein